MFRKLWIFGLVISVIASIGILGCEKEGSMFEPFEENGKLREGNTEEEFQKGDTFPSPDLSVRGASISIAWPFGSDSPNNWTGWTGSRTSGASGNYCGGTRSNTHSGADYYARDLNRRGGDYGRRIYAGISGKIVQAVSPSNWNSGYGGTVVIYDESRHVAVRYSHLSYVAVSRGQQVSWGRYIGKVGNSGNAQSAHLHLAAYENIDHFQGGWPVIPTLCDSEWYTCATYFYCW